MKFGALILPGTSCIEDVIYVFKQVIRHDVDSLLHKYHDLAGADFTLNSVNA